MKRDFLMDEFIKLLDENLEYAKHKIIDDTIYIHVNSNRTKITCSYCGTASERCHSKYEKQFQDLPIQGKKSILILNNRKMFCDNPNCNHKTFAESFPFIQGNSKKTERLKEVILQVAKTMSSIEAQNYLRKNIVKVGKSTICNLLKKGL